MRGFKEPWFRMAEPTSGFAQSWFGCRPNQTECAGTGEHSRTVGSLSLHRSLKQDRSRESVYSQVELDSSCGCICIY